jgi:hypothetical protein
MYIWKCWRDTRSFFIAFLVVAAGAMPFIGLTSRGSNMVRDVGMTAVSGTFGLITMIVALGLGAIGATHEFAEQATHFLFTQPRSRQYFVWAGWSVGGIELAIIAAVGLLASWATLAVYGIRPFSAPLLGSIQERNIVAMFLYSFFVYALTYSLTAVLRSGLKGLGASLGTLTALSAFAVLMRVRWNMRLPTPVEKIGGLPLAASYVVWMSIALLFVYGAQVAMERAEI